MNENEKPTQLTEEQIAEIAARKAARKAAKKAARVATRAHFKALGVKLGRWKGACAKVKRSKDERYPAGSMILENQRWAWAAA